VNSPVVLITGGLSGIGRAAAVAFARKGATVAVAGQRDVAGKALVKELRSFGSEAEFINTDVRKEDARRHRQMERATPTPLRLSESDPNRRGS
jgi:NAD(P)-dependent dehydrogenase (short-subunit alcohol dehydrogenase family)